MSIRATLMKRKEEKERAEIEEALTRIRSKLRQRAPFRDTHEAKAWLSSVWDRRLHGQHYLTLSEEALAEVRKGH